MSFPKEIVAEFIGTFFLVFAIVTSQVHPGQHPFSAGFTLLTQVFTYGYISGGMFNPAVSTGVYLVKASRGDIDKKQALIRWAVTVFFQMIGATIGTLSSFVLIGDYSMLSHSVFFGPIGANGDSVAKADMARCWWAEFLWTFLLVSSVLNTACARQYENQGGNHFFGLTIGFSVFAGAMTVGSWSGGAFNPAVAFGSQFGQCIAVQVCHGLKYFWIYFIANFPAGMLAALVFRIISPDVKKTDEGERLIQH